MLENFDLMWESPCPIVLPSQPTDEKEPAASGFQVRTDDAHSPALHLGVHSTDTLSHSEEFTWMMLL